MLNMPQEDKMRKWCQHQIKKRQKQAPPPPPPPLCSNHVMPKMDEKHNKRESHVPASSSQKKGLALLSLSPHQAGLYQNTKSAQETSKG